MQQILTHGTTYEIGHQHGMQASLQISRSLSFYKKLFKEKCGMEWDEVRVFALKYQPYLEKRWADYVEEMRGVADGAREGVRYEDVLALNVRTEIAFGAFSDGCTAFSWKGSTKSILAQNWDWNTEQAQNLISLKIDLPSGLKIHMVTEAGIIGKIGMNSSGVGCTLNAVKAHGVSYDRLPCHLALRTVLESPSKNAALEILNKEGVASSCHILVADETGGTGVECSSLDIALLPMSPTGIITHTNHFILPHASSVIESTTWLPDTHFRLQRINSLLQSTLSPSSTSISQTEPSMEQAEMLLKDEELENEKGASICRSSKKEGGMGLATLFGVVVDLSERRGRVMVGRPSEGGEVVEMCF